MATSPKPARKARVPRDQRPPRVAVLVETSNAYGRDIQAGIADYAKSKTRWSMFVEQHELNAPPPAWLLKQAWDGIISRPTTPAVARAFRRLKVPVIDLNDQHDGLGFARIISDDQQIGRTAAEHLRACGLMHFAYCGFAAEPWAEHRRDGFMDALGLERSDAAVYESRWRGRGVLPWAEEQAMLAGWLSAQPTPLGVFACNDVRGRHVLEAARRLGLRVPQQVAVVGVDDDELLCGMCDPPLSSVRPDALGIGYRAAERLDRLMHGQRPRVTCERLPPRHVVSRKSTRVLTVEDPQVAAALRIIRQHACNGLRVDAMLQQVPASRSWLDRRFRLLIGHTPHEEIRRVQLQHAAELLESTDLPLKQIATRCGLTNVQYLSYLFKRRFSTTPGAYRESSRRLKTPRA
ncbi:MAG: xylR [Phycisphaerales bacterium]|nr:xylR [Phycisphaerales bacterium]